MVRLLRYEFLIFNFETFLSGLKYFGHYLELELTDVVNYNNLILLTNYWF